jgi:large subunit ribosomal protein L9
MKVILCEDVDNLGDMGQQVNVAPGYARNFLLPRKLAVVSDSASAKQIEHEMRIIKKREEKKRIELTEASKDISKLVVEFSAKAGSEGKLFGSITTLHIANKLEEMGQPVNRKKIALKEPIKALGDYDVVLQLGAGVEATIKVTVKAEAEEAEKAPKAEAAAETDDSANEGTESAVEEAVEAEAAGEETPAEAETTETPAE